MIIAQHIRGDWFTSALWVYIHLCCHYTVLLKIVVVEVDPTLTATVAEYNEIVEVAPTSVPDDTRLNIVVVEAGPTNVPPTLPDAKSDIHMIFPVT